MPEHRKHAIVIGGSMGGLLAARVLSSHYASVTIVERDQFPPVGEQRRGVPQGRHTHGLLASGREVLERHFPGITDELSAAGAVRDDIGLNARWFQEGACLSRFHTGIEGLLLSRPLLEGTVRKRVLAVPNIRVLQGCDVVGLMTAGGRVTGVRVTRAGNPVTGLEADLVVDSAGRGSKSGQWLEEIGYAKPETERVEISVGYTTRLFRRRREHLDGDVVVVIPPTPAGKMGGVMLAQEGGRWTVTLIGYFGNNAPVDLDGFRDFARRLPCQDIYEIIRHAEPLGDAAVARFPASIRQRYERLSRFPQGYLTFGDAICSFNPIYGQGMSTAALESLALDECLRQGDADLARRFFAQASKVVDNPWSIAVGSDLRMPEVTGPRNAQVNFINWYMSKLHKAAHHDRIAALAFHRVANLLAPPPSVMHPRVALRVLLGNIRSPQRQNTPARSAEAAALR